jgi:protease-4
MRGFFKIVLATLLALFIFTVIGIFVLIGIAASASSGDKPVVGEKAVLVLDLDKPFKEQQQDDPFSAIVNKELDDHLPSLHEFTQLLQYAKSDSSVKGLYILCANNTNGFAASEEIRKAIIDFKKAGKFVIAHGEVIAQKGYYIGSAADSIYCNPQGGVEWTGFSSDLFFLKGMLDKLEIQPQIFYAGKFKSATEPLRESKMTDANRIQTNVWLGELYNHFLQTTAASRKKEVPFFRNLAEAGAVQTAYDALKYGLIDGVKYDDEIKAIIQRKLKIAVNESINFVSLGNYKQAVDFKKSGENKVALVFADGDIVSGNGGEEQVGSDKFKNILRKIRLDKNIKSVVFRVNSPGGSALASEVIWREISLMRKEKPVVVSMGDVAASGGYYIACNADSVFANANTITGSIGVFSVVPNLTSFFKNKLGITFDGVKTAPYANMGQISQPLSEQEKRFLQSSVDSIYHTFKTRVSGGRKLSLNNVDSIAQGRVWTGSHAISIGLVDKIGTLQDALECAARMAKIKNSDYRIRTYPEKKSFIEQIIEGYEKSISQNLINKQLGIEEINILKQVKQIKEMNGIPQTKMPFLFQIND